MTATRIVVWRHGNTDWNVENRFQGQADISLNERGRAQAREAAPIIADFGPTALWASDLSRTQETAGFLAEKTGLPIQSDPRLREIHVGTWEGLLGTEIAAADPETWAALGRGEDVRRSATGESVAEVGERMFAALSEISAATPDGETAVVTTHGLAARAGICRLIGLPPEHWRTFGSLDNCAWAVLQWHRGGRYYRVADYNVAGPPTVRETIS